MSKRVRKKSAKLLESEFDSYDTPETGSHAPPKKKKKIDTTPTPFKPESTSGHDSKSVPKLTIKFGSGGKALVSNIKATPIFSTDNKISAGGKVITPAKTKESQKSTTPASLGKMKTPTTSVSKTVTSAGKSDGSSPALGGPYVNIGKSPDDPKKKQAPKKVTIKPVIGPTKVSGSSPSLGGPYVNLGKSPDAPKKRQAPKKVTGKPKKQAHLPTDIEIEAPEIPPIKKETQSIKPPKQTIKASTTKSPKQSSPKPAPKQEKPVELKIDMTSPVPASGKRQRKLPAKLAEDYSVEADLPSNSNKAAKFFETKKAEAKAASAIAKHEASKDGKKAKRNRMPTAYTMWCNSYRAKLQAQCPGMDFGTMNKKLGEVWWSIPLKEKNQWKRKAKRLATHGAPKSNGSTDTLKYLGSKALASLRRNHIPITGSSSKQSGKNLTNNPPVFKVTQTEPVDVAAHFQMMSETLKTVGRGLKSNNGMQVSGSLNMLLDSLLCGVSSLMCLTQQVPELDGDTDPETHRQRQADIASFIPHM